MTTRSTGRWGGSVSKPLLSVIVPTIGRSTLTRTLQSIRGQAGSDVCEILVVADTHGGDFVVDLADVPQVCAEYKARYLEHDGGEHCVGQPQRTYGATQATGTWLHWLQDDDIWLPDAWASIAQSIHLGPTCPRLFRVITQWGFTVWNRQSLRLGNIDADCIVTPNVPDKTAPWGMEYTGDYVMIRDTAELWGGQVVWEMPLIAEARPKRTKRFGTPT